MRLINSDGQIVDAKVIAKDGGGAAKADAQVHLGGVTQWLSTVLAALGMFFGIAAFVLVTDRLDDYADRISTEERLKTQAVDELRVEANVSRKLAGLPTVDSHEHGETK
jgi:hypothetical protein